MRYRLFLWLIVLSSPLNAESTQSSSYLLNKLTENLNNLESVIITSEAITQGSNTPDLKKWAGKTFTFEEFRTDGNRTRSLMKVWGNVQGQYLEKNDGFEKNSLWDDKNYYQYDYSKHSSNTPVANGRVHITPKSLVSKFDNDSTITTRSSINSVGGTALGYFHRDDNRIDHILRTSQDVKVKDQKVQIGDSLCFVLEAETYTGKYKIYLDPERNYSISKLQNIKTAGDKAFTYGYELRGQDKIYYSYETKKFKNVDGQWVASKSESICKRRMHDGKFLPASKMNVNTTGFVLNPDHEAMNSFVPDDIRDGALVSVVGKTEIAYTWQNGELIPR